MVATRWCAGLVDVGTGSGILTCEASGSGTMERVSATGSSGLIFGVEFSSGETSAFLLEVGVEAERKRLVKILFHSSSVCFANSITQDSSSSLNI